MDGFDGVGHQLFKLYAKLVQCKNGCNYSWLPFKRYLPKKCVPHLKFAIRSILVRRTIIEHDTGQDAGTATFGNARSPQNVA
jgi:hypothetical protein